MKPYSHINPPAVCGKGDELVLKASICMKEGVN
jgi:hypothetical protein